jgi:MFS family permease
MIASDTRAGPASTEGSRRTFRFLLLAVLSMTEVLPLLLVSQAMPVVLRRSGASLDRISLLYLVMLPWAFKFLWAPLVDRFGGARRDRYRAWLLVTHPLVDGGRVAERGRHEDLLCASGAYARLWRAQWRARQWRYADAAPDP